jgi:rubrerythrin
MSEIEYFLQFITLRIGAAEVLKILENTQKNRRYLCPNCKTIISKETTPCPKCKTPLRWF